MKSFSSFFNKYGRRGLFGAALIISAVAGLLTFAATRVDAYSGVGSTVIAGGSVSYSSGSAVATLSFATDRGTPKSNGSYCDGTGGDAVYSWDPTWNGSAHPAWPGNGSGYMIYGISVYVTNSAGTAVTGRTGFSNQSLAGGSRVQTVAIDVSSLSPGTYYLKYQYSRNHFCGSVSDVVRDGTLSFVIPNPLPVGTIDEASCTLVKGWSYDTARPTIANDVHLYFSTDPNKVDPAYSGDPATTSVSMNGTNSRKVRDDVPRFFGSPPLVYGVTYGFEYNPMSEPWFTNRTGSVFYMTMHAYGLNASPAQQIGGVWSFGPCWDYELIPSAGVGKGTGLTGQTAASVEVQAGDPITFNTFVKNSGATKTENIGWKVVGWRVPADKVTQYNSDVNSKFASGVYNIPTASPYSATAASENPKIGISSTVEQLSGVSNWNLGHTASRAPYNPFVMNTGADDYRQYNAGASGVSLFNIDSNKTPINTGNLGIGDLICVSAAVSPWAENTRNGRTDTRFSRPACALVTKSPQLQIRGSDSYSGAKSWGDTSNPIDKEGGFLGSASGSNAARGSWSQYGLLSTGTTDGTGGNNANAKITNFGSAGWTSNTANAANTCKLLFANTTGAGNGSSCNTTFQAQAGQFGNLNRTISLPDAAKTAFNDLAANPVPLNDTTCGSLGNASTGCTKISYNGVYKHDGNLTIRPVVPLAGTRLTIVVNGDVYIYGGTWTDIRTTPYGNLGQIPQLTIIANNIFVYNGNSPTNNLYGTFITGATKDKTGTFNSCGISSGGKLSSPTANSTTSDQLGVGGVCKGGQLQIDGALVTRNSPKFQRTFGGGTNATSTDPSDTNSARVPAEIINYTPNLFLTRAYEDSELTSNTTWETMTQRGLPARF